MMKTTTLATILLAACTSTTPGARPHDMSAAQHEREAKREANAADRDAARYDPNARAVVQGCGPYDDVCWRSKRNPTAEYRRMADEHQRAAADHRGASAALRDAEAKACVGIDGDDRDISPFERKARIRSTANIRDLRATMPCRRGCRCTATRRPLLRRDIPRRNHVRRRKHDREAMMHDHVHRKAVRRARAVRDTVCLRQSRVRSSSGAAA